MFTRRQKDATRIAELETHLAAVIAASEQLQKQAILFDIQREGRALKIIFVKEGQFHTIETVALMSTSIAELKGKLL